MELRHLHYFIAVAEELHFSRAAKKLFIAQPPLSQQIQRLEKELGVQLFLRSKRHVELTPAGKVFLEEARNTIVQAERSIQAARRAARGEIGRLTVGFVGSAAYRIIPKMLPGFQQQYPHIQLTLLELTTAQQVQALLNQKIDVGLIRFPLHNDALTLRVLHEEEFVLALAEEHPLAKHSIIPLEAFQNEPFICFPRHLGLGLYAPILMLCQQAGFSPNVVQEAMQMPTVLSLVAAKIGVALVPACVQALQMQGVVYRPLLVANAKTSIALAWYPQNFSEALRVFLRSVEQTFESSHTLQSEVPTDGSHANTEGQVI